MKLVFVYWGFENAGSMLDLRGYTRAARAMGHDVTIYGPPDHVFGLDYSYDLAGADGLVFIFEWTTALQFGDRLDWTRLLSAVPRRRRVVIDCDGAYNDPIAFAGDYNHRSEESSRQWVDFCDSLSDKICQPTLQPRRANVRPFLFHIYDPTWEAPLNFSAKEFSMIYVGHTKFRWRGMSQVLQALETVRDRVGRVGLVGEGWDNPPEWTQWLEIKANYYIDQDYLKRLRIEAMPPVPYPKVIETMGRAVFNPVVYRPLFECLGMVTCRTFETPAASTIPLFLLDPDYVGSLYGDRAIELLLGGEKPHEKILDVLARPDHYAAIVGGIRQEFGRCHSPETRLHDLMQIVQE